MLVGTWHGPGFVPFFVPTDALRALYDALFQIIRCEGGFALILLNAVFLKHLEGINSQLEGDLVQERCEAKNRLRIGWRAIISGDNRVGMHRVDHFSEIRNAVKIRAA